MRAAYLNRVILCAFVIASFTALYVRNLKNRNLDSAKASQLEDRDEASVGEIQASSRSSNYESFQDGSNSGFSGPLDIHSDPILYAQEGVESVPDHPVLENLEDQNAHSHQSNPGLHYNFQPLIAAKAGYFFFSNSTMRKVYDNGGWDIQLSASYPIYNLNERLGLNVYAALEYLHCTGKSTQGGQKTILYEIPVNVGIQPVILITPEVQYFFSLGPRYFYIHQHNNSPYLDKNNSRNGIGLFVNTGFNFFPCDHLLVDVFGEYSYAKTHVDSRKTGVYSTNTQISGFTFGGGLGYAF